MEEAVQGSVSQGLRFPRLLSLMWPWPRGLSVTPGSTSKDGLLASGSAGQALLPGRTDPEPRCLWKDRQRRKLCRNSQHRRLCEQRDGQQTGGRDLTAEREILLKYLNKCFFLHFINILTQLREYPMWNHSAVFFFLPMRWSSVLLLNNFHSCVFHMIHANQLHWFIGNEIQNFSILKVFRNAERISHLSKSTPDITDFANFLKNWWSGTISPEKRQIGQERSVMKHEQ